MLESINIKLDRNTVISVTRPAIAECSENIVTMLKLAASEFRKRDSNKMNEFAVAPFLFAGLEHESFETKKSRLVNWVLKKGFEDLINAVFIGFKEAFIYKSFVENNNSLKTFGDFKEAHTKFQKKAESMNFPGFMKIFDKYFVNQRQYVEALKTINNTRNCLVHRNGIVTNKDTNNHDNSALMLSFEYFSIYGDINNEKQVKIKSKYALRQASKNIIKREFISKTFKLNDRVVISPDEFYGISFFCYNFIVRLTENLPTKAHD